jgi:hypothetical protein
MTGDDPHPPVLTTLVRPNFVFGGDYCLCYVTETSPTEGVAAHGKGPFKATAVCASEVADRFVSGEKFELRAGLRVFAKGTFGDLFADARERARETVVIASGVRLKEVMLKLPKVR